MASLSNTVINSREDLDSLKGTPQYDDFMELLRGSMIQKRNVQIYPDDYNSPEYKGDKLEPIMKDVEDLSTITAFGFKKSDFKK